MSTTDPRDALARLIRERNTPPDARPWELLSEGVRENWRRDADAVLTSDWLAAHDAQIRRQAAQEALLEAADQMEAVDRAAFVVAAGPGVVEPDGQDAAHASRAMVDAPWSWLRERARDVR